MPSLLKCKIKNSLIKGDGYFVVKTVMPLPLWVKKWPHGRKDGRKIVSDFIPTERLLLTERPPKGLKIANKP